MSSRQLEEIRECRLEQYVAEQLGISIDVLASHPYEVDEANHGMVWRLTWQDGPPPDVQASGPEGSQWTDIYPFYEPDEPNS
jgi:hypothetical protein